MLEKTGNAGTLGLEVARKYGVEPKWPECYPITKNWSMESLLRLTPEQVLKMWGDLPPPSVEEMNGYYQGLVPSYGDPVRQEFVAGYMYDENNKNPEAEPVGGMAWFCGKSFRPIGPNEGEGYAVLRFPGGRIFRNMRFMSEIGPSLIDGKPSLMMWYEAYTPSPKNLVDEMRKLDDYIYLGVGSRVVDGVRVPGTFMLTGPLEDWVGGALGERDPNFVRETK